MQKVRPKQNLLIPGQTARMHRLTWFNTFASVFKPNSTVWGPFVRSFFPVKLLSVM